MNGNTQTHHIEIYVHMVYHYKSLYTRNEGMAPVQIRETLVAPSNNAWKTNISIIKERVIDSK